MTIHKDLSVRAAFRVDYVIEDRILVELKAIEAFLPVHKAQVLTYLKLTGLTTGLLFNFNVPVLKDGIRRVVWTPPSPEASVSPR